MVEYGQTRVQLSLADDNGETCDLLPASSTPQPLREQNLKKKSAKKDPDPRVFLGFGQPPLVSAVEWICAKFRQHMVLDLAEILVVLPTSRAIERFLQLLVHQAERQKLTLTPPTLTTLGDFPEFLYPIEKKLATDVCQQLAWAKALQQSPPWELEELFGTSKRSTLDQWQPYAQMISELHRRLASDVWSFRSVVREIKKLDKSFREIRRWEALEAMQGRYYELLDEVELWDKQAARNVAIRRELCTTQKQIVVVGAADINRATHAMLSQVRSHVSVLVAAPKTYSDHFDTFGRLITGKWLDTDITISCDNIRIVDTSDDQAFAVAHHLSHCGSQYAADQVTIGILDPEVEPQIERSLRAFGVEYRNLLGRSVKETLPARLMVAIMEYLESESYRAFAAMIRHPDLYDWLQHRVDVPQLLTILDEYQKDGLPDRIELALHEPFGDPEDVRRRYRALPEQAARNSKKVIALNQVHRALARLLKPLMGKPKSISRWTEPWCGLLSEIYGDRQLNQDDLDDQRTLAACREIYAALRDKQEIPDGWKVKTTATQALLMALDAVANSRVVPPPSENAVEMAGWLDLLLDDAPVMIVTGMNDEHVPASENGHLFLPNSLCKDLGILDNDRRYARDAYALTVIQHVREHVLFIMGRRDLHGEPKKPSRLLFADRDEIVARRASAFFSFEGKSDSRFWLHDPQQAPTSQVFSIPRPVQGDVVDSLTVTSFREFIKCPYRFYLGKILRLETAEDDWQELDGGAFGTLVHDVLEDFGRSDVRDSTDEHRILAFFNDRLNLRVRLKYRGSRLPAVQVQIEQLRLRLERLAPLQAERAAAGWQIISVEELCNHQLLVDGTPFYIRGTIDRIDVHRSTGQVAIWDYKSSDKGASPQAVHQTRSGWKDLQLPLYRHLAQEISALAPFDLGTVQLGYVLLPRQLDKVGFVAADWTSDQLEDADRLAEDIIRRIRAGAFWPPAHRPPMYSEQFAAICQDFIFEKQLADAASEVRE